MSKLDFSRYYNERFEKSAKDASDKDVRNTEQDAIDRANQNGWNIVKVTTNPPDITTIRSAVEKAAKNILGVQNNLDVAVDILMGQLGMETGFKSLHNNNVGNINAKGAPNQYWKGDVIILLAHEYDKSNRKYWLNSLFRAYDTLDNGVSDWASLLKRKFPAAVEKAAQGDITGFVTELKRNGYFTAPVESYLAGVKTWSKKVQQASTTQPDKKSDEWEQLLSQYIKPQTNVRPESNKQIQTIVDEVDQLLQEIRSSEKYHKQFYKALLPTHHFVIPIQASDMTDAIEFARILCSALSEELVARASIHTDSANIEVQCDIQGPKDLCRDTIQQLTSSLVDVFRQATSKIGGITINAGAVINKRSCYSVMTSTSSVINYGKFLLKFAK